jgi:aspartate/methionine/tyrosine aminotransferase
VAAADGTAVLLPTTAADRYQLNAQAVDQAWTPRTRGVLLASPSNPTGTSIDPAEMGRIVEVVQARGGFTLVDEIYLGLSHDARFGSSALAHGDDVISINSFSKYFSMTGWRLGWLVAPPVLVPALEKLAQNLFICPSTIAQQAALACFEPESLAEFEARRLAFRARRDYLVPALNALGLTVPVEPDGAFYVWADCSAHAAHLPSGSWDFAFELMQRAHIALTPGRDFGRHEPERFVRLSYASSMEQLQEAMHRLRQIL